MTRALLAALALALCARAQTALPQNWAGAGAALNQSSKPPVAGWFAYATLISEKGQLYSISTHDVFLSSTKPYTVQSSARTGLATVLRTIGPLVVLGLGDAGMVAGGTALGGAFSAGGIGVLRLGKTNWTIALGARVIKTSTGGNQNVYEFGTGRTF
jgi:hypothetical protein